MEKKIELTKREFMDIATDIIAIDLEEITTKQPMVILVFTLFIAKLEKKLFGEDD